MRVNKSKNILILSVIAIMILSNIQKTLAQTNIKKNKCTYFAINTVYFFAPGGGYSLEGGFRIGNKYRNLLIPVRFSKWAVPHGRHKEDEGYDYPSLMRIGIGICYFPGIKLYQGSFVTDYITVTNGHFSDPESNAKGTFQSIGTVWEIGYRFMINENLFLQGSFGFGWLFTGKVNISNRETTILDLPMVKGLNIDGSLEIGVKF